MVLKDRDGSNMDIDDIGDVPPGFSMIKECSAFLGIINVMDCRFLITVDDVVPICNIQGHKIYTIASISFIATEVNTLFEYNHSLFILYM